MICVRRLLPSDSDAKSAWDRFVFQCPQATFFHRMGWEQVIRETFRHEPHFLYAQDAEGAIRGVLPLVHVRSRLFGNSLTSLPFAVYGGVAASTQEARDLLEREAEKLAAKLRVDHLEFRNRVRIHQDWPVQDLYVTFRKEMLLSENDNLLAIPRKQRAMVRKGIQAGLTSEVESNPDTFFGLYADNMLRHGTPPLPKGYFQRLLRVFGDDCSILTVRTPEGVPVSSVLSFFFKDEVLPYYAGDALEARRLAANDFKYWELMRRSCAAGLRVFDFGRSKKETGSYAFKRNWGFEPQPLHYEFCLYKRQSLPQNNPLNSKYRLLVKSWRRLPIGVANWLGPYIVRSLG